jgi:hypothetical protein
VLVVYGGCFGGVWVVWCGVVWVVCVFSRCSVGRVYFLIMCFSYFLGVIMV